MLALLLNSRVSYYSMLSAHDDKQRMETESSKVRCLSPSYNLSHLSNLEWEYVVRNDCFYSSSKYFVSFSSIVSIFFSPLLAAAAVRLLFPATLLYICNILLFPNNFWIFIEWGLIKISSSPLFRPYDSTKMHMSLDLCVVGNWRGGWQGLA